MYINMDREISRSHFLFTTICDVNKQNESELANTVFKIRPNKAYSFFCFLLFVESFNCLYLWNQLPNLCGVFTKLKPKYTLIENADNKQTNKQKIIFFNFRLILLDHIHITYIVGLKGRQKKKKKKTQDIAFLNCLTRSHLLSTLAIYQHHAVIIFWNTILCFQMTYTKNFPMFDYGPDGNLKHYGQVRKAGMPVRISKNFVSTSKREYGTLMWIKMHSVPHSIARPLCQQGQTEALWTGKESRHAC